MAANDAQRAGLAYVYQALTCATADGLLGAAETPANCGATRVKRWFTASDVTAGVVYANKESTAYAAAKSTYETAATKYNTYLTELKTANEKDAFAAAFAPPTKPALVIRPNKPTKPSTFTGMQHWSAASQQKYWN
jgi:hypothetical protein